MNHRAAVILIFGILIGGCAASHSEDVLVKGALLEKEAASIRLAKAITRYCTVRTDTVDSRHACIVEQRLLSLQRR